MIVCRAELLLLGLERLLAQSSELAVTTYSKVPEADELQPSHRSHARIAVLSDRQAIDVVSDCERLLEAHVDDVVLLSSRPNIGLVLECMGAGARSFVMEGDPPDVLIAAVRAASRGRTYVGQRALEMLVDWLAGQERSRDAGGARTRERDLLRLLAEGRSTAEIAQTLEIAPKTVRNRLSRLYRRLGVRSRADAVRLAEERGLFDGERAAAQPSKDR